MLLTKTKSKKLLGRFFFQSLRETMLMLFNQFCEDKWSKFTHLQSGNFEDFSITFQIQKYLKFSLLYAF